MVFLLKVVRQRAAIQRFMILKLPDGFGWGRQLFPCYSQQPYGMPSRLIDMEKDVLLLDLGGVVVHLGDPAALMSLSISTEEFWNYWLSSSIVRELEIGQMQPDEFLHELAGDLGEAPGAEFVQRFRRWHFEPFQIVVDNLASWAEAYHLALLSNTNSIHWQNVCDTTSLSTHFDKLFLSFESGHFKPAAAAYEQVIAHYNCEPRQIHFLDDAERNVLAARRHGIDAQHTVGGAEVFAAVTAIGRR